MEASVNKERNGPEQADDAELMMYLYLGEGEEVKLAQAEFYMRFGGYLLTLAEKFTYNRAHPVHEAEDMVSLCLVKIFERAESYNPEKGSIKAWIGMVLRNLIEDQYRVVERKRVNIVATTDDPGYQQLEKEILDLAEDCPDPDRPLRKKLSQALDVLSARDREILLGYYDLKDASNLKKRGDAGLTQDYADQLGLSVVNVKTIVSRSLKKIEKYMKEN